MVFSVMSCCVSLCKLLPLDLYTIHVIGFNEMEIIIHLPMKMIFTEVARPMSILRVDKSFCYITGESPVSSLVQFGLINLCLPENWIKLAYG